MDLMGKTVLISGASRGIGEAATKIFAENGANVAFFARSGAALEKIAQDIGPSALALKGNVAIYEDVVSAVEQTRAAFGCVDVLINNAATLKPIAHQAEADPSAWASLIDVNIKGVFYANHCVLPAMKAKGEGTIITISSGAAHNAIEGWSAYCTSKAGAAMLTACTDHEYRSSGIRAMGLSPGTVATKMQIDIKASGMNPVSQLDWSEHIPPEWPAKVLLWMCSKEADPFIGHEIRLKDPKILEAVGLA